MIAGSTKRPAVFMDRDGTITEESGYINHPARLRLLSGAAEAIRLCNENAILSVVTTNQAGVARGYFTVEMVEVVHEKLRVMLARKNAKLDGVYYCPHHPREGLLAYRSDCECRKPRPGMILQACEDLPIDLSRSYMVGDRISDSEFGHALGLRTVMVLTGYGRGEHEFQRNQWSDTPDHIARNLKAAINWILADLNERAKGDEL